jgi:DNA uptake protein ComE-like DNA-binding protein
MRAKLSSSDRASTLVIVLWIAFGLVSLALYFSHSMSFELRAADNDVCGLSAEQTIDGAIRYLNSVLVNAETNGVMPDPATYLRQAVPVGDCHFWLIGRDTNSTGVASSQVTFGLVDEASKLNLNTATSNMLYFLPRMTAELTEAILDWRDTNGGSGSFDMYYGMHNPPYQNKAAPFDTVEELKLVYGADMYTLAGEDLNRNGILDPNETDDNRNGTAEPGVLDYLTVYSREPNTYSNGLPRVDIRTVTEAGPFGALVRSSFNSGRADAILTALGLVSSGGRGQAGGGGRQVGGTGRGVGVSAPVTFTSPLALYRRSGMTSDEFALMGNSLSARGTNFIDGRVNINTANAAVLSCLPGFSDNPSLVQTLTAYRDANPDKLASIAWIVDALGQGNSATLDALQAADCITTQTWQLSADVAALGPHGRGYRRVRVVFDMVTGTPRIIYRQDLTHLGWALGKEVRQNWLLAAKAIR